MKKFFAMILALVMVLSMVACGGSKEAVTLATGGTSGTYYAVGNTMGTVLSDVLQKSSLTVTSTGASKANVQLVDAGDANMAILQSDVLNYAHNGTGLFAEDGKVGSALWVAGLYNETVQLIASPGIESVADLAGKTVCVGDVGSGTALNAEQVLEAYGLTFDDVNVMYDSFAGGAEAMKNGQCDAAFTVAGAPTGALTELAATYAFNMLSLDADAVAYLTSTYPFLVQENLPANTYTCQPEEVVCVAVKAVLVASDKLSEDVVYEMTKAMFDNKTALEGGHAKFSFLNTEAALDGSFDLHPGAQKYYSEVGAL